MTKINLDEEIPIEIDILDSVVDMKPVHEYMKVKKRLKLFSRPKEQKGKV